MTRTARISLVVMGVGVLLAVAGWLLSGPEPVFGENILAGLMVVGGGIVLLLGVLLLLVGAVRRNRSPGRPAGPRPTG